MKWCFDTRVLIGLAAVAVGVLVFAPRYAATLLPVLVLLACPLSMLIMMRGMGGQAGRQSAGGDGGSSDGGDAVPSSEDAEVRRLQEEINTLKARLHAEQKAPDEPADTDQDSRKGDPRRDADGWV